MNASLIIYQKVFLKILIDGTENIKHLPVYDCPKSTFLYFKGTLL